VPAATHIISLTHYRSEPWIEQMCARVNRVDQHAGPYRSQSGYIFCPNDPLMKTLIDRFRAEQAAVVESMDVLEQEKGKPKQLDMFDCLREPQAPGRIITLESRMNGFSTVQMLGGLPAGEDPGAPESAREAVLRNEIDAHIKRCSFGDGDSIRRANGKIMGIFGKKRDHMTRQELERLLAYVRMNFKIDGRKTG